MTRSKAYQEILRLDDELKLARRQMKDAQLRARVTGVKLPERQYIAMWENIHQLERAIAIAQLDLARAEVTAAEKFVAAVRAEFPAVFDRVAHRVGVEA